ncbi:undecaprenyl/decaprenyl-phosphate alpha-N-acetylglucosaminyl 1-phosphate transferase [Lachnospiraceae bacterium MD329]|jgi:UDP-GlcNAc:undecaprenyl-phosphate GlcNAc-1-phosphate transferase|nr:undecaprenyl/decaprenyl-phosphate alpha-N-acetylglucosaminyl 1-phosphate transferase [Lachnospiraceae bacterium MD329]
MNTGSFAILMIFTFVSAFIFTFVATPNVRKLAFRIGEGAVDKPKDARRMHKKPIPRIGGLAMVFGFIVPLITIMIFSKISGDSQFWSQYTFASRQTTGLFMALTVIVVMGFIDDCKDLPAKLKFVVQIAAALIVIFVGDIKIDVFTNPNFLSDNPYWVLPEWLSVVLTVLWIVFITNAVNFIDGLDGLAAGVSAIMSVSLVFISIRVGEYPIAILGIALMGSCFGFLPFNFNPAKIFMGDTGSTFLGFMLATLSIQGVFKSYAVISFAVPLLILGLPLFDASFAMIRRILRGESPMKADRGHLHHRLVDMGFSQKQTVFILYAISGVLGITAVLLAESSVLRALLVVIAMIILILIGGLLRNTYAHSHEQKEQLQEEKED